MCVVMALGGLQDWLADAIVHALKWAWEDAEQASGPHSLGRRQLSLEECNAFVFGREAPCRVSSAPGCLLSSRVR
jgi:hypothetical protein